MSISNSLYTSLAIDITAISLEHLNAYTATEYYLCCESEPSKDALPLQQVRRYLQSFAHLCDVADWRRAAMVLTVELDEMLDEELHDRLGLWGYYEEQEKLYRALLGKFNAQCDMTCYNGLGNIADSRGNLDEAETYHKKHLELAREAGEDTGICIALMGLGNVEKSRGRGENAAGCYRKGLQYLESREWGVGSSAAKNPNSKKLRAMFLGNLANVLRSGQTPRRRKTQGNADQESRQPDEALMLAKQCLKLSREIQHTSMLARTLVLIGDIHNNLNQPEEAIAYHREGLDYAKECRDPVAECDALKGLGETCWNLYEFEEALDWYEQCRKKAKGIGERSLEGQALRGLGMAAYQLENYESSKDYFHQYFVLASEMGDRLGMLGATKGLSYACDALEELDAAMVWETMALQLAEASGDEEEAAGSHGYLGYAHLNTKEYEIALEHLLAALAWQQEHGEPSQMAITYYNLTDTYSYLKESEKAWQAWERGIKLARQYKPDSLGSFKALQRKLRNRLKVRKTSIN